MRKPYLIFFVKDVEKKFQRGAVSVVGAEMRFSVRAKKVILQIGCYVLMEVALGWSMNQESVTSAGNPKRGNPL